MSTEMARIHIVALLPSPASVVPCLDCAVAAAEGLDAEIAAIHVGFDAVRAMADPEEIDLQALRSFQEGSPAERRAQTRAAYEAWLARTKPEVTLTWRDDEGDVTARVTADTATADLVVMRNPAHLDGRDAFHSVLFGSRRLLLVAPPDPLPVRPVIGRHMVVGWKPGPPAERAVRGAAPWLRKAARVSVFCVRLPDRASYLNSARAMLAEIGVAAEPGVVEREGQSVGGQLLVEAKRLGGDSLVIGAFHRGALLRTILGGVTRDVLADLRLPVFMHC